MKSRIFNIISLVCCVAVMAGCSNDDSLQSAKPAEGYIIFDFAASSTTRAVEHSGVEAAVNHLDVFIFENDGSTIPPKRHYERITTSSGRAVLSKQRSSFDADKSYWVYILANCTISSSELDSQVATLADLKQIQQHDEYIHITGLDIAGAPQSFLMDGVAYKGATEPTDPASVQLYNGNLSENTELSVVLRRAAAKVYVTIKRGDSVQFSVDKQHLAGYYIHNMPCSTPLLAGIAPDAVLRNTQKNHNDYFVWSDDVITLKAYLYSHDFTTGSIQENRTTLVVDIPMVYNGTEYPNNYYQIPLSKNYKFERNKYYAVTVIVNAPGAEDLSHPVEVEPMVYDTAEWTDVVVSVGGDADTPKYLNVNREHMEMRYISTDDSTLYFASSSEINIEVEEAYYYNKMGVRMDVDNATRNQIMGSVAEGELTGNITITSPLPTNKTIRYIHLLITNQDGSTPRRVVIEQYPLEYITNIQSWYSYRDDFKDDDTEVTTYEHIGSKETAISLDMESTGGSYWNQNYTWTGNYNYHTGSSNSGFWRSKVVTATNSNGSSTISYYYWNNNNNVATSTAETSSNARIYHIQITSTSSEYKLGNPKLTADGFTDPSKENALLVSPSFMIASRLGFVDSTTGGMENMDKDSDEFRSIVREHCANYVEVYKDSNGNKVVLDDWRLPTEAELNIIINYQGTRGSNADAIDYLLNAAYYWAASGRVYNPKEETSFGGSNNVTAFRCIRDAIAK